jgi:hypothetical protein
VRDVAAGLLQQAWQAMVKPSGLRIKAEIGDGIQERGASSEDFARGSGLNANHLSAAVLPFARATDSHRSIGRFRSR